ncbi:hypothetical protein LWI29_026741 [Acer saccharum]|uniref:Uncharacterized protein n=1 Tax=Acer saccharum TaxID=4024 RepID=A0AA39W8T5_ACESA|nr:hypothetical protein LWI29_026741 [Acer saccharum]
MINKKLPTCKRCLYIRRRRQRSLNPSKNTAAISGIAAAAAIVVGKKSPVRRKRNRRGHLRIDIRHDWKLEWEDKLRRLLDLRSLGFFG